MHKHYNISKSTFSKYIVALDDLSVTKYLGTVTYLIETARAVLFKLREPT